MQGARDRSKRAGCECLLSKDDILIPDVCPVLGLPLEVIGGKFSDNSPTLDRIDNNKGYTKGNVLVVSWRANRLKADATLQELRMIAAFYGALPVSNDADAEPFVVPHNGFQKAGKRSSL